jgi:hypothetical protein
MLQLVQPRGTGIFYNMILLEFINTLITEEGPRIPHPEDAIFTGSPDAARYFRALQEVIDNPGSVSIKWDGGIALFFGNKDGKFVMTDKYMPNKGVYPASPAEWKQYDEARGADRGNLYDQIATIWDGLKAAVGSSEGLFKGDLMWVGQLQPVKGQYIFKPTTVEYRVPASSELGKRIAGKVAGIAVHSFNNAAWDGKTGLANSGNVLILTPTGGINFTLKNPVRLVSAASQDLSKFGKRADEFLSGMDKVAVAALQKFMNKQITGQTSDTFAKWLETNVSGKQLQKLTGENGYLIANKDGLDAVYAIWNSIYKLKENIAQQLEQQVKGFEQWTGGKQEGEGFVFNSSVGLVKVVNRAGFGAAHFGK